MSLERHERGIHASRAERAPGQTHTTGALFGQVRATMLVTVFLVFAAGIIALPIGAITQLGDPP